MMNRRFGFVLYTAIAATLAGVTLVMASVHDDVRSQLHHLDLMSRDLVPIVAETVQRPGDAYYEPGNVDNQTRALIALGAFHGEANAFHELWDRNPYALGAGARADLDRSFRSADGWIRRAYRRGEVSGRWNEIRNAYFRFQGDLRTDERDRFDPRRPDGVDGRFGYSPRDRSGDTDPQIIIQDGGER